MAKVEGKVYTRQRGQMKSRMFKHLLAALGFIAFAASVLRPTLKPNRQRVAHKRMSLFRYGKLIQHKVRRMWHGLGHGRNRSLNRSGTRRERAVRGEAFKGDK
jgi:hypothetical protein